MDERPEVLPCPFCGGAAEVWSEQDATDALTGEHGCHAFAGCPKCDAGFEVWSGGRFPGMDEEEMCRAVEGLAAMRWNRREWPGSTAGEATCPAHYRGDGLTTAEDAAASMLSAAPEWMTHEQAVWWWQALKYVWRWPLKGDPDGDLDKAADCLRRLKGARRGRD